jgi:hypothetical protein
MFHYRWFYEPDQASAAERIAGGMMPDLDATALPAAAQQVKERMVPRLRFVGSTPETKDQIEASYHRQLAILERHLAKRSFLFGGRPAFADFGLYAQLYQCSSDPTPGAVMRRDAPAVLAWIERMLDPRATGEFEEWSALAPTLQPLLRDEIGAVFFPWTVANARALTAGATTFSVPLDGREFTQDTQKYHAKSLAALRARYAAIADKDELDAILSATNCLTALRAS